MSNYIYKSKQGEKIIKDLYDQQVKSLDVDYEDLYVDTRYGKTHVLKIGNADAKPIILFHGGNSTAPYSLKQNMHLIENYLIYAPDIIGHPGKSDQRVMSSNTLEYGYWASDVIDSIGYNKVICMGDSFGGGILTKLMCASPEKISKAILLVPAGICNVSKLKLVFSMGIPMTIYIITRKEKWFERAFLPMTSPDETIDKDTLDMIRTSFHHVKVNPNMPSNVKAKDMKNYQAPTLLFAGEKDVLFPGKKIIERSEEIIPNIEAYLLKDCGHIYFTSDQRKQYIKRIINRFLSD